jgi:hypothetical protein
VKPLRLAAILVALLVLAPPRSALSDVNDGDTPSNGKPDAGKVGAGWDGTTHRVLRTDPNGILRTAEEYPNVLQSAAFTAAVSENVHVGLKQIGNGWSVSPYGDRVVRIRRTATGTNGINPCYLYLFSSDNNVNFTPLVPSTAWTTTANDTNKVDTLMVSLPAVASGTTIESRFALPQGDYPGRYLAIWARRDSANGTAQTLTITFEGRYK